MDASTAFAVHHPHSAGERLHLLSSSVLVRPNFTRRKFKFLLLPFALVLFALGFPAANRSFSAYLQWGITSPGKVPNANTELSPKINDQERASQHSNAVRGGGVHLVAANDKSITPKMLRFAAVAANLSAVVYECKGPGRHLYNQGDFELVSVVQSHIDGPCAYVVIRKFPTNVIFIAFRGTRISSPNDIVADQNFTLQPLLNEQVWGSKKGIHAQGGFWGYYMVIQEQIISSFESATAKLDSVDRVVVTGHSLGGALATLCTTHLLVRYKTQMADMIYMITFGGAVAGDSNFVAYYRELWGQASAKDQYVYRSIRFTNANDPVPRYTTAHFEQVPTEVEFSNTKDYWPAEAHAMYTYENMTQMAALMFPELLDYSFALDIFKRDVSADNKKVFLRGEFRIKGNTYDSKVTVKIVDQPSYTTKKYVASCSNCWDGSKTLDRSYSVSLDAHKTARIRVFVLLEYGASKIPSNTTLEIKVSVALQIPGYHVEEVIIGTSNICHKSPVSGTSGKNSVKVTSIQNW